MAVDYKQIGQRIKEKRVSKNMTQEVLAEKLNVTVGYVSQCERGISRINLEKLSEISAIFDCDISCFVSGTVVKTSNYLNDTLMEKYAQLTPLQKKNIIDFIDVMIKNELTDR